MAHNKEQEDQLKQAKLLREDEQPLKAIQILTVLRNRDTGWWAPVIELFMCYQALNNIEPGLKLITEIEHNTAFMQPTIYVALLRFFMHFNHLKSAKTYFEKLQSCRNLDSVQLVACARYLQTAKRHEEALKYYDRAIAANKKEEIFAKLDKGRCLQEMGRLTDALNIFRALTAQHPRNEQVSRALSCCLRENGYTEDADKIEMQLTKQGLSQKTMRELTVENAIRLRTKGRYEEALKLLNKLNQDDKTVQLALARTYQAMHRFDEAIKFYTSLTSSPKHQFDSSLSLACCYEEMGRHEKCFYIFQQLQTMNLTVQQRQTVLLSYARSLQTFGKYDEALTIYQSLLAQLKIDRSIRLSYARCLEEMGKFEDALNQYNPLLTIYPSDPSIALSYLRCSIKCGKYTKNQTELAYIQLKKRFPNNANIAFSFLLWKLNNGVSGQYQKIFPPLIAKFKHHQLLRLEYAKWLFDQGKRDEAVQALHQTITIFTDSHQAHFLLVSFYCAMGQFDKAKNTYQNFLEKTSRTNVFLDKFSELFRQYGIEVSDRSTDSKETNQKELQILFDHAKKRKETILKASAWGSNTGYVFGGLPLYYLFFPRLKRPATIDFITNVDLTLISRSSDSVTSSKSHLTLRSDTITSTVFNSHNNSLGLKIPPTIRTNTLNYEQVYLNAEDEPESPIPEIQEWITGDTNNKRPPPLKMLGDAKKVFEQTPLDMLDIIDKASQLKIAIDEDTQKAIKASTSHLKTVPIYRLNSAIRNLFTHGHAAQNIRWMQELGIFAQFFPELSRYLKDPKEEFFHNWFFDQLKKCDDFVKNGHKASYEFICSLCLTTPNLEIKNIRAIVNRLAIGSQFKYERITQTREFIAGNIRHYQQELTAEIIKYIRNAEFTLQKTPIDYSTAIRSFISAITLCEKADSSVWMLKRKQYCEERIGDLLDRCISSSIEKIVANLKTGHNELLNRPAFAKEYYERALVTVAKFPEKFAPFKEDMNEQLSHYHTIATKLSETYDDVKSITQSMRECIKLSLKLSDIEMQKSIKEYCENIIVKSNTIHFETYVKTAPHLYALFFHTWPPRLMYELPQKLQQQLEIKDGPQTNEPIISLKMS